MCELNNSSCTYLVSYVNTYSGICMKCSGFKWRMKWVGLNVPVWLEFFSIFLNNFYQKLKVNRLKDLCL